MIGVIAKGLLIPFLGTSLGALCVIFMKKDLNVLIQRALTGFAAGVMMAASVWSLLIPSIEESSQMGKVSFIPAVVGFCIGMLFLLLLDKITPHMHMNNVVDGPQANWKKTTMMVFAVVLHNIPEGMAVGVVYAGWYKGFLSDSSTLTAASALGLSIGIAIQNFPEGAIISMPLHANGLSKGKSCLMGILSGCVEPIAGLITILLSSLVLPILPYLLSFAAGAMVYVIIEELIPEMSEGEHSNWGTIMFMIGFALMMVLDVALG